MEFFSDTLRKNMNFKKEYQNHSNKELLKMIIEDNDQYTKDALVDIIELLKQKGNISKLILENYSAEKLVELILTKKDYIPEIKAILDSIFKEAPNKFDEIIKKEKQSSGEINLIISGAKVIDTKRDLIGNIIITDKNIYFITTKISNLPENLAAFYSGGILFGLIGEVMNKLANKPKTFEKTADIPLNILAKYIDGSFKINLSNILLVRINNKNNHFAFKTKINNQWSYHFFAENSEDREKIRELFQKNNITAEPSKGFLKTLVEMYF